MVPWGRAGGRCWPSPVTHSHLQSGLFPPQPTAAVKSHCSRWRVKGGGSTNSVTHEKHGKLSFPVFPSACVWLWSGCSWMLFQETSGELGQLVARETDAHSLSPSENQGERENKLRTVLQYFEKHLTLTLGRQKHWCWCLPPVALLRIIINDSWSKMNCSFPEMNAMQANVFWGIDTPCLLTWTFIAGQRRERVSSTGWSWPQKLRSEEVSVSVRMHWSITSQLSQLWI